MQNVEEVISSIYASQQTQLGSREESSCWKEVKEDLRTMS